MIESRIREENLAPGKCFESLPMSIKAGNRQYIPFFDGGHIINENYLHEILIKKIDKSSIDYGKLLYNMKSLHPECKDQKYTYVVNCYAKEFFDELLTKLFLLIEKNENIDPSYIYNGRFFKIIGKVAFKITRGKVKRFKNKNNFRNTKNAHMSVIRIKYIERETEIKQSLYIAPVDANNVIDYILRKFEDYLNEIEPIVCAIKGIEYEPKVILPWFLRAEFDDDDDDDDDCDIKSGYNKFFDVEECDCEYDDEKPVSTSKKKVPKRTSTSTKK